MRLWLWAEFQAVLGGTLGEQDEQKFRALQRIEVSSEVLR